MKETKAVLSIAGSDSSAGAGIQADIKSVAACGGYCATAITAITAQNTCRVEQVAILSAELVAAQINAVLKDLDVNTLKLGMIPSQEIVDVILEAIEHYRIEHVVLDPVMVATSGDLLVDEQTARYIIEKLFPVATIITPNIPEAEFITGITINGEQDFETVAARFEELHCTALLLKAGHLDTKQITDHLFDFRNREHHRFSFPKTDTPNTHGTGCSLSSAIAAWLSRGYPIADSVKNAEIYIHKAIAAAQYTIGKGHGPIAHFYMLNPEEQSQ